MRSATATLHPDSAQVLAALELQGGPRLYLAPPDEDGCLLVMKEAADPGEGDAIVGLAVLDGSWYLGCTSCRQEISKADAGMCVTCRQDAEEQLRSRAGYE